ncbi:MAG: DNA-directed RNA polymerase subunit K [Candidatus Njordarchaeota archaeon]
MALKKQIISDKVEIGPPRLTRYEYAAIVAMLAVQIAYGAPVLLSKEEMRSIDQTRPIEIAKLAVKKKKVPLTILRYLSTGEYQLIPISWLEIEEEL